MSIIINEHTYLAALQRVDALIASDAPEDRLILRALAHDIEKYEESVSPDFPNDPIDKVDFDRAQRGGKIVVLSKRDHEQYLRALEALIILNSKQGLGSEPYKGIDIDELAAAIEAYEKIHHPIVSATDEEVAAFKAANGPTITEILREEVPTDTPLPTLTLRRSGRVKRSHQPKMPELPPEAEEG